MRNQVFFPSNWATSAIEIADKAFVEAERVLDSINREYFTDMLTVANATKYPPYNFVDAGDGKYVLEMAVAGYPREALSVETENGVLTVRGDKPSAQETNYIWKGLASRAFTRHWKINGNLKVDDVQLADGMLYIYLHHDVPEHLKVKKFDIRGAAKPEIPPASE